MHSDIRLASLKQGLSFLRSELLGDVGGKLLEGATLASLEDLMPHLGLGLGVQVELLPKDPKVRDVDDYDNSDIFDTFYLSLLKISICFHFNK